jgi:hypothetical protein
MGTHWRRAIVHEHALHIGLRKMKYYFSTIFLVIQCFYGFAQESDSKNSFQYKILDTLIHVKMGDPHFSLRIALVNHSRHNFILYKFKEMSIIGGGLVENDLMKFVNGNGAVNEGSITNKFGEYDGEFTERDTGGYNDSDKVLDPDFLEGMRKGIMEKYIEKKVIVKSNSTKIELINGDLGDIATLKKGEYYFHLFYVCGKKISEIIDVHQLELDKRVNKANVFVGWFKSNKVRFIVE